ncbi:hypothetical protein [Blastopirellula marina]|uniref:Uncharacterized protein n=1 Tax=Blastopirellula marina TaxID=124 RepID=A0A2S8FND5_9BACT|nr:hypothetical protein [Blastopirellula marina]PQO33667.1 hypothetical protein C5Y98_15635 [Blastopirellula marina]PTL43454.1 hypothetical protein C5Y97_15645 [Blastopirellula marina]
MEISYSVLVTYPDGRREIMLANASESSARAYAQGIECLTGHDVEILPVKADGQRGVPTDEEMATIAEHMKAVERLWEESPFPNPVARLAPNVHLIRLNECWEDDPDSHGHLYQAVIYHVVGRGEVGKISVEIDDRSGPTIAQAVAKLRCAAVAAVCAVDRLDEQHA